MGQNMAELHVWAPETVPVPQYYQCL